MGKKMKYVCLSVCTFLFSGKTVVSFHPLFTLSHKVFAWLLDLGRGRLL